MGVDITAVVYWGVLEPKAWMKTRRVRPARTEWLCSANDHPTLPAADFCSKCGSHAGKRLIPEFRPENGYPFGPPRDHAFAHDTNFYGDEPWVFGVRIVEADTKGEEPQAFEEPKEATKQALAKFLTSIGYGPAVGPAPGFLLVLEAH